MDAVFTTPLLDMFRRGEVERDLRLLFAQSGVSPRAHEQLALLVLLADDDDPDVRNAAAATLALVPRDKLAAFLARPDAPVELRRFFAARGVEQGEIPAASDEALVIGEPESTKAPEAETPKRVRSVATMSVMERIKVAMRGSREERAVLIRDSSKLVAAAVLSSPKLTDTEVEGFARMANTSAEVLRIIGANRAWVKNYAVAVALVRNAKTPIALSLGLIARLTERDLKMLAVDRNVPEPVRVSAQKAVAAGHAKRG